VVGAPAGDLRQPPPLAIPARTLEDAYAHADARNPVLAAAYARERISRASAEAARAELFPRIGVEGRATTGSSGALGNGLRQTDVRGALTVTGTLDSGIAQARLGEARAANDADWRLIDAALRDSRAELAEAWNEWQARSAEIERLAVAVDASRQALEGALLQERAGLRTTLEVLELARDLLTVRTSYNATTAAAFVARVRVLAAMGELNHEFLLPDAAAYDPQDHLGKVGGSADLPLVTAAVRALDSLLTSRRQDRPVRDPAAPIAVRAADPPPADAGPSAE
jgi:outer membrane protein